MAHFSRLNGPALASPGFASCCDIFEKSNHAMATFWHMSREGKFGAEMKSVQKESADSLSEMRFWFPYNS